MKTLRLWVRMAILITLGCFYAGIALAAGTFSSSPSTAGGSAMPGGTASAQKMVYGPIQFGFIVDVRGGYWGGTSTSWANFIAQCPAGSVPTTASPPAPPGVAAGQLTVAEVVADGVACGCGSSFRCKPGLMGPLNNMSAGIWTRAYCIATVTGYMPESFFKSNTTQMGTFYQQKIFTQDSSGKAYIYNLGNDGSQNSSGNKFPGMPNVTGASVYTGLTGHTCANP
jgi:hypothetical protein